MLQGHFISLTFKDYRPMKEALSTLGTSGNIFFDWWCELRGYTAPLFFTITGLVFVFLLTGNKTESFWKQKRVRKGIRRGISIMLWGYLLQLNFKNVSYYLSGRINDRFFAFHVLQSIGLGILVLILIYSIHYTFKKIKLSILLFSFAILIFFFEPIIESFGNTYIPSFAPKLFQNMVHGPNSIFPIFPWLGFVFMGGAIGAVIREQLHRIKEKLFPLKFALIGSAIYLIFIIIFHLIDVFSISQYEFSISAWHLNCLIRIHLFISLLMFLEQFLKNKKSTFIMMGQNTLSIYIVHVIILYGSLFGIGIKTWYDKSLNFTQSITGAILFILFFGVFTIVQPRVTGFLSAKFNRYFRPNSKAKSE